MPDQVIQFFATVGSSLFLAIATSVITVNLALRRYRNERWWERKEKAYSNLLEVIFGYVDYTDKHIHDIERPDRYTDEEKAEWQKDWRSYNERYAKARGLASLHLSKKAVSILETFDKERLAARNEEDFFDWMQKNLEASEKCLEVLIAEAKSDLGRRYTQTPLRRPESFSTAGQVDQSIMRTGYHRQLRAAGETAPMTPEYLPRTVIFVTWQKSDAQAFAFGGDNGPSKARHGRYLSRDRG